MHYKTKLQICGVILSNRESTVIVYYWQMQPPITITITSSILPDYYYYSGILRSLLLLPHKCFITITITISNSLTTLVEDTRKSSTCKRHVKSP